MKKRKWMIGWAAVVVVICAAVLAFRPSVFETDYVTISSPEVTEPLRIAHLSDVHNKEYGEENQDLIQGVAAANPDLIFITGDAVSTEDEAISSAVHLTKELSKIAPVYFSYGNHDLANDERFGRNIGAQMEEAGACVLDFSYEDIVIRGQTLRIGGIYGYCTPAEYLKTGEADEEECDFLEEFQDTDGLSLLLAHMPFAWIENDGISKWNVDFVFAGHSHGGQIILPLIGPVYAPDQGWFPERVSGHFLSEDKTKHLLVSRGLGDSVSIPRINNNPELVIVDIIPEEKE